MNERLFFNSPSKRFRLVTMFAVLGIMMALICFFSRLPAWPYWVACCMTWAFVLWLFWLLRPGHTALLLDERGITRSVGWRQIHYAWRDIEGFRLTRLLEFRLIAIDFKPDAAAPRFSVRLARMMNRGRIENLYDAPLDEVHAALNEWRRRYGGPATT